MERCKGGRVEEKTPCKVERIRWKVKRSTEADSCLSSMARLFFIGVVVDSGNCADMGRSSAAPLQAEFGSEARREGCNSRRREKANRAK